MSRKLAGGLAGLTWRCAGSGALVPLGSFSGVAYPAALAPLLASRSVNFASPARFIATSPSPSQAAATAAGPPTAADQAPIAQDGTPGKDVVQPATELYQRPFSMPTAPAFGLGLFAVLAATAGEWLYFTDEFLEIVGFWCLFLTVYRLAAPLAGQTFDETAAAIRQAELDKIQAAKADLGLEELAKRYAPASAAAGDLVAREVAYLKGLEPKVEAFMKASRMKTLLDMHLEAARTRDQALKEYL